MSDKFVSEQREFERWLSESAALLRFDELGRFLLDTNAHISRRTRVAAALGETKLAEAAIHLRRALDTVDEPDLLCPLMIALGRVLGAGATQDVRPFLDSRSPTVRQYAFIVEGYVGDLSIEERMMAEWTKVTRAAKGRQPSSTTEVLRYLGRHFDSFGPELQKQILRDGPKVCHRASAQRWISHYWPGLADGGPLGPSRHLQTEVLEDEFRPPERSTGSSNQGDATGS